MKTVVLAKLYRKPKVKGELPAYPSNVEFESEIDLPEGCIGIMYVFRSKRAAFKFWGKPTDYFEIALEDTKHDGPKPKHMRKLR